MNMHRGIVFLFCLVVCPSLSHGQSSAQSRRGDERTLSKSNWRQQQVSLGTVSQVPGGCSQPPNHCQAGDQFTGLGSNRFFDVVADDFVASGSTLSSICWWGAYAFDPGTGLEDCANPGVGDNFEVRYYSDNGGLPGTLLASFGQSGFPSALNVVGPVATTDTVADLFQEYVLTATHAPVSVTPGTRYWIEISNSLSGCEWFWETASQGNLHAVQDGIGGTAVNGYDAADIVNQDLAFCLDIPLERAANDECVNAQVITGSGQFSFDNFSASTDGLPHPGCILSPTPQIANDQWYCWTAPFTDKVVVRTCELTDEPNTDTVIAVYEGCSVCTPGEGELLMCNDDRCVDENTLVIRLQSLVTFDAIANQSYLIRVGNFFGGVRGTGSFEINSPPASQAGCPGAGNCCGSTGTPGCDDDNCCRTVCACDPFCCTVDWDLQCATLGYVDPATSARSLCGAQLLCESTCDTCGSPTSGECCEANGSPSCSDDLCCETVCARDPYCCEVEWDDQCVSNNQRVPGADAERLCATLCNCGDPAAGDCCDPAGTGSPGCSNSVCCSAVCDTDNFCCDNEWDSNCVVGFDASRPGALTLCEDLCACPHTCGDFDGDIDVSMRDVAKFMTCFSPLPQPWSTCKCADLDLNGSVDLVDYSILVDLVGTGSSNRSPNCP